MTFPDPRTAPTTFWTKSGTIPEPVLRMLVMNQNDTHAAPSAKRSSSWRASLAPVAAVFFGKKSDKDDDDDTNFPRGPGALVTGMFPMFSLSGVGLSASA